MKASHWNPDREHLAKDVIFDITGRYPSDDQPLGDALMEDDDVVDELTKEAGVSASPSVWFLVRMEEEYGLTLPDDVAEDVFTGEIKVGALCDMLDAQRKVAEITSAEDRARAAQYRAAHKEELRRKAKKRRSLIAKGLKQKMRRIGTAATGYTYVADSGAGAGAGGHAAVGGLKTTFDFRPDRNTSPIDDTTTLRWK